MARSESVSEVVGTGQHILGGGEKKGGCDDRGSDGFIVVLGFVWRGVKWSEQVDRSGVEWSGRVNVPILTTCRN